jgi:hypothetical protein
VEVEKGNEFFQSVSQYSKFLNYLLNTSPDLIIECLGYIDVSLITEQESKYSFNSIVLAFIMLFDSTSIGAIGLLKAAVEVEVEFTISAETLFRRNSISTKLISLYAKLQGLSFLQHLLKELIENLVKEDKSLEIDPNKLQKGESIEENGKELSKLGYEFLESLFNSEDKIPYELKVLLSHLRMVSSKKYEGTH